MTDHRILIVDALSAGSGKRITSRDAIGCGPRSIAGILEERGYQCRIKRVEDILHGKARLREFEHVAISAMSMDRPAISKVIRSWRRHHRGRVLLGGPIASGGKSVLTDLRSDAIVIGEGEATLSELLDKGFFEGECDLADIRGVGYMADKTPTITEPRPLLTPEEMDRFRPSIQRVMDYPAYQASRVYVEVIRGCSNFRRPTIPLPDGRACTDCGNCDSPDYKARIYCPEDIPPGCGFCSVPATWGAPRSRKQSTIVEEVRDLLDLEVHRIVLEAPDFLDYERGPYPLTDPCSPTANIDAIKELLADITALPQFEEGTAHLAIENMKACLFTEEVAQAITQYAHDTSPNIGLESGSSEHIEKIGKSGTPTDVLNAVRVAHKFNMSPFVYLIYGLPGETSETVEESIRLMMKLSKAGAERIILYGFQPLPGSAFADFPPASFNDPLGKRLRDAAEKINRGKKDRYLNTTIKGIAAEPSLTHRGYTMVYPLSEGPIMTVPGGYSAGTLLTVKITKVLSAGLLLGRVVH
ncbi:MAG: B12-binding domain-containing radical SAM protein [Candidatus Thorarchaeota archaeon]|nr:B12-binding domain-containing radical SAM protein [Candidatus Thorarchaeota archaeon]